MKTAAIVAFDLFTDVDVFLPWDLLNRARLREPAWWVRIVGTAPTHRSVGGLEVATHAPLEACHDADVVLFARGPGTRALGHNADFRQRLRLDPPRQVIGSMCSGALILAAPGLLDGLTATTSPTPPPWRRCRPWACRCCPTATWSPTATLARRPAVWRPSTWWVGSWNVCWGRRCATPWWLRSSRSARAWRASAESIGSWGPGKAG